MVVWPFQMAGNGWEALWKGWEWPGVPPGGLGVVRRSSWSDWSGWEAIPEGRKAISEGREAIPEGREALP